MQCVDLITVIRHSETNLLGQSEGVQLITKCSQFKALEEDGVHEASVNYTYPSTQAVPIRFNRFYFTLGSQAEDSSQ